MGLNKSLYQKRCEGRNLTVAEKRFCGLEPYPEPKTKKIPKEKQTNEQFVTDMIKDLL